MSQNKQVALVIQGLSKHYNAERGISDITLSVAAGEVFGFLGPNGAGKSTTINTILDILRADAGTVRIFGLDHHNDVKQAHARLGYLSGDMETDPSLTGKQYLDFVAHIHGNVSKDQVASLVDRLKADLQTKIKHLSRGNKQKIGLIAALMHDPELLILDEPTSGLDPLMQAEFNKIINEYKARGKAVFISSHVLSEVQNVCDRVGFIRSGRLVVVSTLDTLLKKAPRRVSVRFEDSPPISDLQTLPGVSQLQRDDGTVYFLFNGDFNALLGVLHKHSLKDLQISETDLEELFMKYYANEKDGEDNA